MTDLPPTVLLTRPQAQSERSASQLEGVKTVISPVLRIGYRKPDLDPHDFDRLIFTSENGVRAAAAFFDLSGQTGYAVGPRTAEVGAEFGLDLVAAAGTADDLVPLVIDEQPAGRLLHLRGAYSRGNVAERLQGAGLDTHFAICYDQVECSLTSQAKALLAGGSPVILPVFSPRSASLLGRMCTGAAAPLILIAISPAALQAWTGPEPFAKAAVSIPSAEAVHREILRHAGRVT